MGNVSNNNMTNNEAAIAMMTALLQGNTAQEKPTAKTAPKAAPHDYKAIADGYDWGEGGRNENMHRFLSSLQARGFSDDEIRAAADWVYDNKIVDKDGYTTQEIEATLEVVLSYKKGKPGGSAGSLVDEYGGNIDAAIAALQQRIPYATISQVGQRVRYGVDINALADYIAAEEDYVVLGNGKNANILWLTDGVYKPVTTNWVKGHIKELMRAVDDGVPTVKLIDDTYSLLLIDLAKQHKADDLNAVAQAVNFRNGVLLIDDTQRVFIPTRTEMVNVDTGAVEGVKYDYTALRTKFAALGVPYLPTVQLPADYHEDAVAAYDDVAEFCGATENYKGCGCPVFLAYLNDLCGMPSAPAPAPAPQGSPSEFAPVVDTEHPITFDDITKAPAGGDNLAALNNLIKALSGGSKAPLRLPPQTQDGLNSYEDAVALKRLLLFWIGLTISGYNGYDTKRLLMLVGAGNTGKSQFIKLLEHLVGAENTVAIDLREMNTNRFALSSALGKRLIIDPDVRSLKLDDISTIKQITGGDRLTFENKGKDPINGHYNGTVVMAANELPKFGGDKGDHVYERFVVVPCNNIIPIDKRDPYIVDKMTEETDAIIQLALTALQQQLARGLNKIELPTVCLQAIEDYKDDNDPTREFLHTCTRPWGFVEPSGTADSCTAIYAAYKSWAEAQGVYVQPRAGFLAAVKTVYGVNMYHEKHGPQNARYYIFRLTDEAKREQQRRALDAQGRRWG